MAGRNAMSEPGDGSSGFCPGRTCVASTHNPLAEASHVAKPNVSEMGNISLPQ